MSTGTSTDVTAIVVSYEGYIHSCCKHLPEHVRVDAMQELRIKVFEAVEGWKSDGGRSLHNYIAWSVRRGITDIQRGYQPHGGKLTGRLETPMGASAEEVLGNTGAIVGTDPEAEVCSNESVRQFVSRLQQRLDKADVVVAMLLEGYSILQVSQKLNLQYPRLRNCLRTEGRAMLKS